MRGSVFKRGKSWTASIYLGRDPVTGRKRYKQYNGFRTKKLAEDGLVEQLERLRLGEYVDPGRTTFGQFVERWLTAKEPTVRATTFRSYKATLDHHVLPHIGGMRLDKISGLDLAALYAGLLDEGYRKGRSPRGLSPASVRYAHRIIKQVFGDAVRWGLLARNPVDVVDPPRVSQQAMKTWSADQVRQFLTFIGDDRLRAMWVVFCTTGMRRGEVLALRWEDLDLPNRRLSVRRSLVEVDYEIREVEPKTPRSRRSVSLDPVTVEELARHRRRQAKERLAAGAQPVRDYVFTHPSSFPLQPQNVSQAFGNLARAAGLPIIRLHDLRHTSASLALSAGIHPKVVSERLGHSTVQLTLDLYSHVAEGIHEGAADELGAVIFGGKASRA
jgi:integrase